MCNDIPTRIAELEAQIATYPIGSVGQKQVHGRTYFYHRFTKDGKRKEQYIPEDEVEALRQKISQRKELQSRLKKLKKDVLQNETAASHKFMTDVRIGDALRLHLDSVRNYKKRIHYQYLHDYVYGDSYDRVLILFGLRRTGKTTMIRQILADMSESDLARAAFIQSTEKNTLVDINEDLKYLESKGYRYVFIDEVTLMQDFIDGAAVFSDIYAACGMKIVLSGTDSLGFLFSESDQLYDRYFQIHTTHISYLEFEAVLGIKSIDEYIRYGGTMSISGTHYNDDSTFAGKEKTDEYVDSAISKNIQHSLENYQYGNHFRNLRDLYEQNELTNVINRVVEDINRAFLLRVLTDDFKSHDFGRSANTLRRTGYDILDHVDKKMLEERLKTALEIHNLPELSVTLTDAHLKEITQYLIRLDMIYKIAERSDQSSKSRDRLVIAQPGLRYAQANALMEALLKDALFGQMSMAEQNEILGRIRSEIMGRMMEDIVLLETQLANPKKEVFVLHFDIGEFDMVVSNPETVSCEIYEIKHSTEIVAVQYQHLINEEKCKVTEFRFGKIMGKYVIYRGKDCVVDGIRYLNVEEYLKELGKHP